MNYYPNYSTHRLYFGEVETPYNIIKNKTLNIDRPEVEALSFPPEDESGERFPFDFAPNGSKSNGKLFYY